MAHDQDYSRIYVGARGNYITSDGKVFRVKDGSTWTPYKLKGSEDGLSIEEVGRCLGSDSRDLGTLCRSSAIKWFAKFKPQSATYIAHITDAQRGTLKWGISIPQVERLFDLNELAGLFVANWTYSKPTGNIGSSPYRIFDFTQWPNEGGVQVGSGYYNGAPATVATCVNKTYYLVVNTVNENAQSVTVAFYLYSRTKHITTITGSENGVFYDRRIDDTHGIGAYAGHTATQMNESLAIEDMGGSEGDVFGDYARFVLILKNGTTYYEVKCNKDINLNTDVIDYDMHQLTIGVGSHDHQVPTGQYEVVACLRRGMEQSIGEPQHLVYSPLFYPTSTYRNKFNLNVGGLNLYNTSVLGVSESASGTPSGSIRTKQSSVYIWARITNNSGTTHLTTTSTINKWSARVDITGSYVDAQGSHTVNRSAVTAIIQVTRISIANGGHYDLSLLLDNIWSEDGRTLPQLVTSGSLVIRAHAISALESEILRYDGQSFPLGQTALCRVEWGNEITPITI